MTDIAKDKWSSGACLPKSLQNPRDISAKDVFDSFYRKASKRFSQNFLFNESVNRKIVEVAGNLSGKIVVEVGPGPGGLTLEILKRDLKRLYIIEYDKHWAEIWRQHLQPLFEDKLVVIEQDALQFDMCEITPDIIISNLPYNISTQLLCRWLPDMNRYEKMVLMFQKEVADRICAEPDTKAYGKLSVLSQWKAKVSKKFDLEPGCFSPPPKVRSSVVEFLPKSEVTSTVTPAVLRKQDLGDIDSRESERLKEFSAFSAFLNDVFAHKRKMITKALTKYFENPTKILQDLKYEAKTRPENISVDDYWKMFEESRKSL